MPDIQELVRQVRARTRTTGDTDATTDNDLVGWLWDEMKDVSALIKKKAPRYFNETIQIAWPANVQERRMPERVGIVTDVMLVDAAQAPAVVRLLVPIEYQDMVRFGGNFRYVRDPMAYGMWYQRERNTLGVIPSSGAQTIQVNYDRTLPEPSYGTPAVPYAAGTLVLAVTPTVGRTRLEDGYYEGAFVEIISGTGAGQVGQVSAFDSVTRTCTMTENWAVTPDATSVYGIRVEIPEDYHGGLVDGAVSRFYEMEQEFRAASHHRGRALDNYQRVIETMFPIQRQDPHQIRKMSLRRGPWQTIS